MADTETQNDTALIAAQIDALDIEPEQIEPFRLFDLPSELRVRIYEHALAPSGVLTLTSTGIKRFAVEPAPTLALLRTCRQIHNEADGMLYSDNEVVLTVDAHETTWPLVSEKRLPQSVLEKLQHLCVILYGTPPYRMSYDDVDFDAFEALISLKTLRLAMICPTSYVDSPMLEEHMETRDLNAIAQILERVAADAKLRYGTLPGSQQHDMACQVIRKQSRGNGDTAVEVPAALVESIATAVPDLVRGCKSGVLPDVYAQSHAQH